MTAVPSHLTTAPDFVVVRTALIRHLGGALEAVVFTRIQYRVTEESRSAIEHDGRRWYTVTYPELAAELASTEKQIRRVLDALTASGSVSRAQLRTGGNYDRRYSYTPEIAEVPKWADRSAPEGASSSAQMGTSSYVHKDIKQAGGERITHPFEPNARNALIELQRDRRLPLSADELLEIAYHHGNGNPWDGYLKVKHLTEDAITSARNPGAVLRKRLEVAA